LRQRRKIPINTKEINDQMGRDDRKKGAETGREKKRGETKREHGSDEQIKRNTIANRETEPIRRTKDQKKRKT
jgi:hypothetical protein